MTKFKDVAHFYLGCKSKNMRGGTIGYTLSGVLNSGLLKFKSDDGFDMILHDFKPILRPFSSVTENESIELELADVQIGLLAFGHRLQMHMTPDQFKKCLDLHIDMFGLIESGEAIDATTLNKSE